MRVPDLVAHAAARYPGRPCVVAGDRSPTFAEVDGRAGRLAGALRARGLGDGARVALLAYNEPEFVEIRVAAQRAGALLVPLNYRLTGAELAEILADCDPGLLILGPGLDPPPGGPASGGPPLGGPPVLRLGEEYEAWLDGPPVPGDGLDAGAPAMIAYTSGTTGRPKGAVLSHGALHAGMLAMGQEIGAHPDAVYLTANPMFHIGALVGYSFTYLGATCRQLRRFDAAEVVRLLAAGEATHTQLVPSMIREVLDAWPGGPAGRLERILYGAAPMPPELARRTLDVLGCGLVNGYGSTEAMGISMLAPHEHDPDRAPHLLGSVGRGGIGMVARVVDAAGAAAAPGEIGEIVCRGPSLMTGYWNDPAGTAEALRDGWFHTGDLGRRDADGFLYLMDRRNDKIVTGGENVYPTEVENVLTAHPHVHDAAVVGIPDERWGEAVCAAVIPEPGAPRDAGALLAHCRAELAGYKVPKRLAFVADLPKSPTGKLIRRELRERWPGLR